MAHYPAVSVFNIDNALVLGNLWDHVVRQVLIESPIKSPGYMFGRMLGSVRQSLSGQDCSIPTNMRAGLKLLSRLDAEARSYLIDYVIDRVVRDGLRPGAVDTLVQRRKAGDRIVLMSSCFDICVARFAGRLGGADIISTRTFETDAGKLTLDEDAQLCEGAEKFRRLKNLFDGDRRPPFIRAFAVDAEDYTLLSWADAGYAVNPTPKDQERAASLGLTVVDWTFGIKDAPLHTPKLPGVSSSPDAQERQRNSANR
ncbi:MAG: haloacid dehalogenase-like hydrolase [Pseudomonadota bacterium]